MLLSFSRYFGFRHRSSKFAAQENIAKQLSGTPPLQDSAGIVHKVTVLESSSKKEESSLLSCSPVHPSALGLGVFASPTGGDVGGAEDLPSNFEELTDAKIGKWNFHEPLVYYMDGENKIVEFAFLFEAGTYVRNLNTMGKVEQADILLSNYQKLIEAIEDEQLVC